MAESRSQAGDGADTCSPDGVVAPALFDAGEASLPARVAQGYVPRLKDVVLTPEQVQESQERWPDASEAQQLDRMRRSVFAKLRHEIVVNPSTGRRAFGGAQPGAGRKRELGNTLAEAANRRDKEIIDAIFSALDPRNDPMDRHKAGINIVREVRKDREADMRDDGLDGVSKEDLADEAAKIILEMLRAGEIDLDDTDAIIDAQVVEG